MFDHAACRRRKHCDWRCLDDTDSTLCVGCERHVATSLRPSLSPRPLVTVTIDGEYKTCSKGRRLIDLLHECGIDIPSLCYHPRIASGKCKVCLVEVRVGDQWEAVTACDLIIAHPISVRTTNPSLAEQRKKRVMELLRLAPTSIPVRHLAENLGLPLPPLGNNQCILCERCLSICRNIHGQTVLEKHRGAIIKKEESKGCKTCGACVAVCPTGTVPKPDNHQTYASCRLCEIICPELAITSNPETGAFFVDFMSCKSCGLCANICPENAIRMVAHGQD